jgi:hypothetical protein
VRLEVGEVLLKIEARAPLQPDPLHAGGLIEHSFSRCRTVAADPSTKSAIGYAISPRLMREAHVPKSGNRVSNEARAPQED